MKYLDEFRDPRLAKALAKEIQDLAKASTSTKEKPLHLMEFCGGHTHTIFRYGIQQLIPPNIELIHGPGCPVCVLPLGRVDDCIALAQRADVILTTFADVMRVPGSQLSLLQAKATGCDIRTIYSPMDALATARTNPDKEVIFFALGFETTMPSTALTVLQAASESIPNFSVFCNHITTIPTIKSVLDSSTLRLDGLIAPGHVSMVVGISPFALLSRVYHKPIVISGFEPLDILQSISLLLKQISQGRNDVKNQYARVVTAQGNEVGQQAMNKVFESRALFEWRGLGSIENSGIKLRTEYARFDAERKFPLPDKSPADPPSCQCSEVLQGTIKPWQCKIFGSGCTPMSPVGALMVSPEGACAAYYNFDNRPELLAKKQRREAEGTL